MEGGSKGHDSRLGENEGLWASEKSRGSYKKKAQSCLVGLRKKEKGVLLSDSGKQVEGKRKGWGKGLSYQVQLGYRPNEKSTKKRKGPKTRCRPKVKGKTLETGFKHAKPGLAVGGRERKGKKSVSLYRNPTASRTTERRKRKVEHQKKGGREEVESQEKREEKGAALYAVHRGLSMYKKERKVVEIVSSKDHQTTEKKSSSCK